MKRMTFALSVPIHVYVGLHLLKRICGLRLVGAQQQHVQLRLQMRCWWNSNDLILPILGHIFV
jgi:hypothetical protein